MSKKLIAVASAAALALSALVVMPTVATATPGPFAVAITGEVTADAARDGSTSAKALQISVPTSDVLRFTALQPAGPGTGSVIKLVVTTPGASDAITVTSTGAVKVVTDTVFDETAPAPTSASGVQSLTDAAATGTATIYAYTTSTAVGTVVVSAAGSSRTIFIAGLSTFAYKAAFTGPTSVAPGGKATLTGTVKDMFGNDLTTALETADFSVTAVGGSAANLTDGGADWAYNATTKVYTIKHVARDTAGSYALSLNVDTASKNATKVTAFGDLALTAFFSITANDPTVQIAALTAQVTALQAQLEASRPKATSVTKKKYNTLARKWNAANPGARVALKK